MALQPNGFRFRSIPRKVPGLSANPLGFRGGGGAAMQEREPLLPPPRPCVLPRRRAHQAHAPLFEWTKLLRFQTRSFVPLSSTSSSSSSSSSSSVCLFFCGGLGVGEERTRFELVRSTHRVPSPFISSNDFPSRPFGEPWNSMGLAAAYGTFLPAVYHPFVLKEAG
jgi:hypothetical protein